MKLLLVGGAGFIGAHLAHELKKRGHQILIVDMMLYFSDHPYMEEMADFRRELINEDIIKEDFISVGESVMMSFQPDYIIHLGALPLEKPIESAVSQIQLSRDILLTYEVVRLAKKYDCGVLFMSSIFAYGDHDYSTSEDRSLNPKTPYGIAKAAGEHLIRGQLGNHKIVRTTSVYGFGDSNNRATQIIINRSLKGQSCWINQDSILDFIYIQDLVAGISQFIESPVIGEAIHISGGRGMTLLDYTKSVSRHIKINYEIRSLDDRPKRGTLDNTKARILLNWEPKHDLDSGIDAYMKFINKYGYA